MSAEMTQNQATLIGQGVTLHTPSTLPDAVKSPTWNADGTFNGWAAPVSPAGVGTELQYRDEDEFGAVAGSSFVGGVLTVASLASDGVVSTGIDGYLSVFGSAFFGLHGGLPYIGTAIPGSAEANDAGMNFLGGAMVFPSPGGLIWHSGNLASGLDVGLSRNAAATLQVDDLSGGRGDLIVRNSTLQYSATDAASSSLLFKKSRGTVASPLAITTPDQLGALNFQGYSGAAGYVTGAQIRAVSEGTIATTRVPSKLVFATGTDAAPTVLTDRMVISNAAISCSVPTLTFIAPAGTSALINLDTVSDAQYVTLNFKEGGANRWALEAGAADNSFSLYGYQTGTFVWTASSTGLVGINKTSSIGAQLHVVQSTTTTPGISVDGITNQSVPLFKANMGATPTGNVVAITTSGGSEGDLFKITSAGSVFIAPNQRYNNHNGATYIEMITDMALVNANVGRHIDFTTGGLFRFNTGTMQFGTRTAIGAETVTGYITIKDSGGVDRKLAVVS